jgi:hypothetical protein
MNKNLVDVSNEGEWFTHLRGQNTPGGYETLCGLDGNDPECGQQTRPATKKHIDCPDCSAIINACKGMSRYLKK